MLAASGTRVFASPLAKKLASEKGIELAAIQGTGPHNRIIAADVEEYVPGETALNCALLYHALVHASFPPYSIVR